MGPSNSGGGAVTQLIGEGTPLFKRAVSRHFFFVWDYVPHVLPFAGDVDARKASDFIKTAEIAWTRVHAIINQARG